MILENPRKGWKVGALGKVCKIKPPKKEAKQRLSDTDLVSFVPMNNLGVRQKQLHLSEEHPLGDVVGSYTYFADGDVLLAKITPCFENGKLGIARGLTNGVGFGSSEFIVFRPGNEIDPEYLFYFLSQDSFRDAGARVMSGAVGHKRVPKEFIENYPIPFPPLPEQKRIVAILDEAFTGIATAVANTEKNLANARELFEGYLNRVFSEQSEEWISKRLEDVVASTCSLSYGIVQPGKEFPDGLPVVRPTDLTSKVIHLAGLKRIDPSLARTYKRTVLLGDELLLCVRGSTGALSVASHELKGSNVTRGIVPIRFEPSIIGQEFAYYQLSSKRIQDQIKANTYGTALMQINIRDLRKITVLVPPIEIQHTLVRKFDGLADETTRLESIYQQKLTALTELKQSLLQKAFSGQWIMDN